VEIPLSRAHWATAAGSLLNRPLLSNSTVIYEFHAMLDHVRDRVASKVTTWVNSAGELHVTTDMHPVGGKNYQRKLVVGHGSILSIIDIDSTNQPVSDFSFTSNVVAVTPSLCCDNTHSNCYLRIKLSTPLGDPGPVIRFSPTLAVTGDEVIIMPEDAVHYPGPQNRLLITGSGVDSLLFDSEELGLFGNGHTGLGTATIVADTETLTVGHLGSSGNNGVAVNFNNALNALVSFTLPASNSLVRQVAGTFLHEVGHNLGQAHFSATNGAGVLVTTDFSPIGASNQTIEVRSNSQLLQRITGHSGNIGSVSAWPAGLGEQSTDSPTGAPGCIVPFGQVVQISVNGGPTLQGDELRVFPENPTQAIGNLQALNLQANGFDSITVINETVTPALTPSITSISPSAGTNVVLSVPTAFGYDYTLDAVDALGPHPWPWAPVATFFGDGSVQQIALPANNSQQFFRVRVESPGM
jgi:hypothetical protein